MKAEMMDLALVTETWLTDNVSTAELSDNNRFEVFRVDRRENCGGGVLLLVRIGIPCAEVTVPNIKSELVAVDLLLPQNPVRLICAYFSPSGSAEELKQRMTTFTSDLESLVSIEHSIVLAGDINLPSIDWSNWCCPSSIKSNVDLQEDTSLSKEERFLHFCSEYGLQQLVTEVTRPDSNSLLDLILVNDDIIEDVRNTISPVRSDHLMITFTLSCAIPAQPEPVICLDWNKSDFEGMILNLESTDWNRFFSSCRNVDEMYNLFIDYMKFLITVFVPQRTDNENGLKSVIRRTLAQINNSDATISKHNLQKKLDRLLTRERLIGECKIIPSSDPKTIHKYVRSRLKVKDTLAVIRRDDGSMATENFEKSEILKEIFCETYPSEEELRTRTSRPLPFIESRENLVSVNDVDTSVENLHRHLQRISNKRSETPEELPALIFKSCGRSICAPLSLIFRRSLEDQEVPTLFRCAIICPIHKKGDKCDPHNKRPVSLTSVPCKLLESVISDAIYSNAVSQGLIFKEQFAYRPGHSAVLQLLETQNDWGLLLNEGKTFDCVYFDFKSAFETVTHDKLINLLPKYGVGEKIVGWISAFLRNRTFRVRVKDRLSSPGIATSGCPQGTILGPLAYILYTDSLKYIMSSTIKVKVYADDVKVYTVIENDKDAYEFQQALNKFHEWTLDLDLKLSVEKCNVLHFGRSNKNYDYTLGGMKIQTATSVKDLGVLTTASLKYTPHITDAVARSNRRANWLLRAFILKDAKLYMTLYKQYVIPALLYASPVWNTGLAKDRNLVLKLHRKFLKRVAYRCNVRLSDLESYDMTTLLESEDDKMFSKILKDDCRTNVFFHKIPTRTRKEINIYAKAPPRRALVRNLFAWRMSLKS